MFVTLYKKCILSKDYTEVFDCTARTKEVNNALQHYSFFADYLDTLSQITYEIDDVYITNEGSFNLPFTFNTNGDFFEYNYMRLSYYTTNQHEYRTTRYCFIDNIEPRNEIAIVSYTTDIWHSFSAFMTIRNSYLSRSKLLTYLDMNNVRQNISPYNIPVEYDGVNLLSINSLFKTPSATNKYHLILELQKYTSTTEGNTSNRQVSYKMIQKRTGHWNTTNQSWDITYQNELTMEEVIEMLNNLTIFQGGKNLKSFYVYGQQSGQVSPVEAYYEIGNIYIVPIEYLLGNVFDNTTAETTSGTFDFIVLYQDNPNMTTNYIFCVFCNALANKKYQMNELKTYTITNDFTNIGYGHITKQFELNNLGVSRTLTLNCFVNDYDFKLLLNIENKIEDITDNYFVEVPFTSIDGTENSQKNMARHLKNMTSLLTLIEGGVGLANGGTLIGSGTTMTSTTIKNRYSRINPKNRTSQQKTSLSKTSQGNIAGTLLNGITDIIETNAPLYSSTNGTFAISSGWLNAFYGLCIFKINPSNETYVNKMIDETGYISYYIGSYDFIRLNENEITTNNIKHNILKYDFINLYGDFSQEVADTLKGILLNGVKVWYSSSV